MYMDGGKKWMIICCRNPESTDHTVNLTCWYLSFLFAPLYILLSPSSGSCNPVSLSWLCQQHNDRSDLTRCSFSHFTSLSFTIFYLSLHTWMPGYANPKSPICVTKALVFAFRGHSMCQPLYRGFYFILNGPTFHILEQYPSCSTGLALNISPNC